MNDEKLEPDTELPPDLLAFSRNLWEQLGPLQSKKLTGKAMCQFNIRGGKIRPEVEVFIKQ